MPSIRVKLGLQGLTLPPLIRMLGLAGTSTRHPEKREAPRAILQAAIASLEERICMVITTAGIRYAKVTHTHIRAPAHSWSWRGDRPKMWVVVM